jgi:predicted GIY-YIG superfamily endonuclease
MSIGIYKIENLINGKIYIGQSIHIEKRWQEHCKASSNSLIAKSI